VRLSPKYKTATTKPLKKKKKDIFT
jgi:hypothetical protein